MGSLVGTLTVLVVGLVALPYIGAASSIVTTITGGLVYAACAKMRLMRVASGAAFVVLFVLYLAWALLCWNVADALALNGFANRWVLLLGAAALAGAPYYWAERSREDSVRAGLKPDERFGSALAYAGGLQSCIVLAGMVSGIWFDWWPGLPG